MSATVQARQSTSTSFGQAPGKRWRARLLVFCLLLMALSTFAVVPVTFAQGSAGTVRGDVKDPNGAVVPNATVTLVSERGAERKATTSSSGTYTFTSVDPGQYTIRVEGPGFKTSEQQFSLAPNETRGLDVALEIGTATETVTVTDQGSAIKTETDRKSVV